MTKTTQHDLNDNHSQQHKNFYAILVNIYLNDNDSQQQTNTTEAI